MKFYKSFYAVVIGIATLHFCAWGMEHPLEQSIVGYPSESKEDINPDLTQTLRGENPFKKAQPSSSKKVSLEKKESVKTIFNLENQIQSKLQELTPDTLKKYNLIINPIQKKLENPQKLKRSVLNRMNYSLRMIQEEDATQIIKDIERKNLNLKNRLNILEYLSKLPNPIFYEEPVKNASRRSEEIIKQDKNELKLWLAKKNEIKQEIENLGKDKKLEQQAILQQAMIHDTEKELVQAKLLKEFTPLRHKQTEQLKENKEPNILPNNQNLLNESEVIATTHHFSPQEAIKQRAEQLIQENKAKQAQDKQEYINYIDKTLANLKTKKDDFEMSDSKEVPRWIAQNIQDLDNLKNELLKKDQLSKEKDQEIGKLRKEYEVLLQGKANRVNAVIRHTTGSPQEKLAEINLSFPEDNKLLTSYRKEALEDLMSVIVNQLNQKKVLKYNLNEKQFAIENIIFLADNIAYLPENKKDLFNEHNFLNILFAQSSYKSLINGVKDVNEEELKKALETIKKAINYEQWKVQPTSTTQSTEETKPTQPIQSTNTTNQQQIIRIEQQQPTNQQIINQQLTRIPTKQPTQEQKREQRVSEQEPEQQKTNPVQQPQPGPGIFATIGQAIGGFFRTIASGISSAVSYILSIFSGR
ncbi:MAG TPA: hypothetical protein VKU36_05740 [Candidatus Babeliales bacterium]|nr:hypothetical protein [Candidatus Babeliales bacterium]